MISDAQKKVRLQDVTSITLHRGQKSTGRRSSPVPQLLCVGGTAQGKFSPSTVQCYNRGFDGNDVQWECTAEMPSEYKFGRVSCYCSSHHYWLQISVSCEGYDYPDDPYILSGSCALKYELDYTQKGAHNTFYNDKTGGLSFFDMVIIIVVILMIAFVLYSWCSGDSKSKFFYFLMLLQLALVTVPDMEEGTLEEEAVVAEALTLQDGVLPQVPLLLMTRPLDLKQALAREIRVMPEEDQASGLDLV